MAKSDEKYSTVFVSGNSGETHLSPAKPPSVPGKILRYSPIYTLFQYLVGERRFLESIVEEYIRVRPGQRLLDIGCGTANIVGFLPKGVEYHGFDVHEPYIRAASKTFAGRGTFCCANLENAADLLDDKFDIVIALGVLHHLDDDAAAGLFSLARNCMTKGGRLISVDGCYCMDSGRFETFMLKHDRGKFVRSEAGYAALAEKFFARRRIELRKDLLRIPYSSLIMELMDPKRA